MQAAALEYSLDPLSYMACVRCCLFLRLLPPRPLHFATSPSPLLILPLCRVDSALPFLLFCHTLVIIHCKSFFSFAFPPSIPTAPPSPPSTQLHRPCAHYKKVPGRSRCWKAPVRWVCLSWRFLPSARQLAAEGEPAAATWHHGSGGQSDTATLRLQQVA